MCRHQTTKGAEKIQYGNEMSKFPIPDLSFSVLGQSLAVEAEIKLQGTLNQTDMDIAIGGCATIDGNTVCDNNICVEGVCINRCVLPFASRVMSMHD